MIGQKLRPVSRDTQKQTDKQTVKRTYIKFTILASNKGNSKHFETR